MQLPRSGTPQLPLESNDVYRKQTKNKDKETMKKKIQRAFNCCHYSISNTPSANPIQLHEAHEKILKTTKKKIKYSAANNAIADTPFVNPDVIAQDTKQTRHRTQGSPNC